MMQWSSRLSTGAAPKPVKPEGKKLRRKLQKIGPKQTSFGKPPELSVSNINLDKKSSSKVTVVTLVTPTQPARPLPPDLSDSKWLEYVRKSGCLCALDQSAEPRRSYQQTPAVKNVIPEFAHLTVKDEKARSSSDTLIPDSPSSSTSALRRHAKTPVFAIGQLEGARLPQPPSIHGLNKISSVELIAEQYRALIGSRDSVYTDLHSEPPPPRQREDVPEIHRQHGSEELRADGALHPTASGAPQRSPTSDDGTLVAFDDETIYFKPAALLADQPVSSPRSTGSGSNGSHASHSHSGVGDLAFPSPSQIPDNLSLKICLDMLTRELAAVTSERPRGPDVPSLQVGVMIKAYERLRDQLLESRQGGPMSDEAGPLEMMFDTWLRALYTIHDSMSAPGRGVDEAEYALD